MKLLIIIALLALAGCENVPISRQNQGVLIGAGVGAVIGGAVTSDGNFENRGYRHDRRY